MYSLFWEVLFLKNSFSCFTNTLLPFKKLIFSIFFFIFGFCVILFHGSFESIIIITFSTLLCVFTLFIKPKKIPFYIKYVFLICAFILISFLFNKGSFLNTFTEFSKWLLLITSAICFLSDYKTSFISGIYSGISLSAFVGILAYFKIIPDEIFNYQLAGEVDGVRQLFSFYG